MNKTKMKSPLMTLEKVSLSYPTGAEPFEALKNVDLTIHRGEFLGITGKSGAGKSTLLNMITGISDPSSGTITYFPIQNKNGASSSAPLPIHTMDEDAIAKWRGKNVGVVYQSFELMPTLDLVNNVMMPPDFLGTYQPIPSNEQARALLAQVDIEEHADKIPAHISGGQKQRVAIARALVNDPPLIVADEPTGNLDSVTAETIFDIFEKLVQEGKTVVMVTHDESMAHRFSRRLHIVDGVLTDPNALKESEGSPAHKAPALSIADAASLEIASTKNGARSSNSNGKDHSAISLTNVSKIYESPAGRFVALKNIDLELNYGQFVSIVGKSGSGKSTLINMITGIDHPTDGKVIVSDHDIYALTESERALWRGKNMGVVFQFFQLLPTLTLLENTMLPMDYCDVYPFNERSGRALKLLERVGLGEQAHKLPASVSSGQQQSAAIARAMATDPSIILADEPTGNLDSKSAEIILQLFEQLASEGKTILIVTHDPSITSRTDQTIILSDGEIVDEAVARALPLLTHPQMLEATKKAERKLFSPGEVIIKQGQPVDHFYMVDQGSVEVVVTNSGCEEFSLARLGPGQYFGEVELTSNNDSIASVRASSDQEALIAYLPKKEFIRILSESDVTQAYIRKIASTRVTENRSQSEEDC